MKKLLIFTLLLSGVVLADNIVDPTDPTYKNNESESNYDIIFDNVASNIYGAQRWPWNGKVDINYTLTATTTNTTPVFSVRFFVQDPDGIRTELTSLTGDGTTGIIFGDGQKKTTWDAAADLGTNVYATGYKIGVYAADVTEVPYLVLDLTTYKMTASITGPSVAAGATSKYAELWFRRIEPGTFVMGSVNTEVYHQDNEKEHIVTLTKAYYIGVFELTEGQYDRIMNDGTSTSVIAKEWLSYDMLRGASEGATWPVPDDHRVDSDSFFGKLRAKIGNDFIFDLPTEAQWEAAARWKGTTGNGTNDYYGSKVWNNGAKFTSKNPYGINDVGWYKATAGYVPKEVGLKAASTIGTYDMHGNVWEFCLDRFADDITSYTHDPVGPTSGTTRVMRGGSNNRDADQCRMAYRYYGINPALAFELYGCRVVLLP